VESDSELLGRLRAGDEAAFATLVSRYQQPMLRLARTMVPNAAVAEETVQDTWMGVVKGIDRFEERSAFKTWLFRILANRARSAASREPVHSPLGALATVAAERFTDHGQWSAPPDPWFESSDDRMDAAAWLPALRTALECLPDRQRQVVLLRDVEGLTSAEVCSILDLSAGNQRILLHRGRAQLRQTLETAMTAEEPRA